MDKVIVTQDDQPPCTLNECPPGLFIFKGILGFKSEYTSTLENPRRYQVDAYVVESGEYFHGGAKNSKERGELIVQPLAAQQQVEPVPVADRVSTTNPVVDHETGNASEELKPVAWMYHKPGGTPYTSHLPPEEVKWQYGVTPLYAHPPKADRQATRAALVAEIVEWLKGKAAYAWSRESGLADEIAAKWGKQ